MLDQREIQVLDGILNALAAYCYASKEIILERLAKYLFTQDEYEQIKTPQSKAWEDF